MNKENFPESVPVLQIGDYELRGIEPDDTDALYHFMSDKKVTEFTSLHADTKKQVESWITLMLNRFKRQSAIYWVIADSHNKAVGRCHFSEINAEHSRGEIGYYLSREYWGEGIATNALRAVVKYGFGHLELNRIEATTFTQNYPSARVLEKVGFGKEGTRHQYTFQKGRYYDVDLFALLQVEWKQKRNKR